MSNIDWKKLDSESQVTDIEKLSYEKPVVIFKHSTRCSISAMALDRLERNGDKLKGVSADVFFLDLIRHRGVSNRIADVFKVTHQSPQVLVVKDGKAVYDESHMGISADVIRQKLSGN